MGDNFTVSVPSTVYNSGVGSLVPNARFCKESTSKVRRRKPVGWIPPTPYEFRRDRHTLAEGSLYYDFRIDDGPWTRNVDVTGCVGGSGHLNSLNLCDELYTVQGVPTSFRDKALIKARLKMKQQDVNLAVAFAERNRTATLIGDTAINLVQSMRSLRRGQFKAAARHLGITKPREPRGKSITGKWLELQYGWQPLLSDVHGSVEALARRDNSDWIVTGKASHKEDIDVNRMVGSQNTYSRGQASGLRGVFVRIDAIPENDLLQSMASLGITNPAMIAWELVPFSFVVDWFLPIGNFVDSLDAMLGYGPTWCSISTLEKVKISHTLTSYQYRNGGPPWNPWYEHHFRNEGRGEREYVSLNREVFTSVPLPTMPRLKDPRSLGHMANGLALLSQVFGGRKR